MSKYKIILFYTMFFVIASQLASMGAPVLFEGVLDNPQALACQPTTVWENVTCFFQNLSIFFRLMTVSSEYAIVSSIIITPLVVLLLILIIETIVDLVPL